MEVVLAVITYNSVAWLEMHYGWLVYEVMHMVGQDRVMIEGVMK